MKKFLLKYKRTIIFWIIFSAIALYFAPRQKDYYLDSDINLFKEHYLTPILICSGIILCLGVFLFSLAKTKSFTQTWTSFWAATFFIGIYLLLFQDLFLAGSLFINRQFKRGDLEKSYIVDYLAGTEKAKDNFFPVDISTKQTFLDRKLVNKLYKPSLKQFDTVTLKFDKGLFGINFQDEAMHDN